MATLTAGSQTAFGGPNARDPNQSTTIQSQQALESRVYYDKLYVVDPTTQKTKTTHKLMAITHNGGTRTYQERIVVGTHQVPPVGSQVPPAKKQELQAAVQNLPNHKIVYCDCRVNCQADGRWVAFDYGPACIGQKSQAYRSMFQYDYSYSIPL